MQEAAGATVLNKPLPTPDATGTMAMAAGGWQVWLANTTSGLDPVDGDVRAGTPDPLIIDFVGAATNSASYETQAADEAPSATLATTRDASNTDTDNNKNDFSTATPAPKNSQPVVNVLAATNPGNRTVTVDIGDHPDHPGGDGWHVALQLDFTGLPAGIMETSDGMLEGTPDAPASPRLRPPSRTPRRPLRHCQHRVHDHRRPAP